MTTSRDRISCPGWLLYVERSCGLQWERDPPEAVRPGGGRVEVAMEGILTQLLWRDIEEILRVVFPLRQVRIGEEADAAKLARLIPRRILQPQPAVIVQL